MANPARAERRQGLDDDGAIARWVERYCARCQAEHEVGACVARIEGGAEVAR